MPPERSPHNRSSSVNSKINQRYHPWSSSPSKCKSSNVFDWENIEAMFDRTGGIVPGKSNHQVLHRIICGGVYVSLLGRSTSPKSISQLPRLSYGYLKVDDIAIVAQAVPCLFQCSDYSLKREEITSWHTKCGYVLRRCLFRMGISPNRSCVAEKLPSGDILLDWLPISEDISAIPGSGRALDAAWELLLPSSVTGEYDADSIMNSATEFVELFLSKWVYSNDGTGILGASGLLDEKFIGEGQLDLASSSAARFQRSMRSTAERSMYFARMELFEISAAKTFVAGKFMAMVLRCLLQLEVDAINRSVWWARAYIQTKGAWSCIQHISKYVGVDSDAARREIITLIPKPNPKDIKDVLSNGMSSVTHDRFYQQLLGDDKISSLPESKLISLYVAKACLDSILFESPGPGLMPHVKDTVKMDVVRRILGMDSAGMIPAVQKAFTLDVTYAVCFYRGSRFIEEMTAASSPELRISSSISFHDAIKCAYLRATSSDLRFKKVDLSTVKGLPSKECVDELGRVLDSCCPLNLDGTHKTVASNRHPAWDCASLAVAGFWIQGFLQGESFFNHGDVIDSISAFGHDASIAVQGILPNVAFVSRHARIFNMSVCMHVMYNMKCYKDFLGKLEKQVLLPGRSRDFGI